METQRYPTYQYIKFIWQKKFYLIGFTILCMIIAALFSFNNKPTYTSSALIFMGNGKNDELSKPVPIINKYNQQLPSTIRGSLNVEILGDMQIMMSVSGGDKKLVESQLNQIAQQYKNDLSKDFYKQKEVRQDLVNALKDKIDRTEKSISLYDNLITKNPKEENLDRYTEVLMNKEEVLVDNRVELYKHKYKLVLADGNEPKLYNTTTTASSNNLLRNLFLAAAFGFQVMLLILVLWKYIMDARRSIT
ncbi:Wzz/FepE/Etk N-terminal domain-containing protein [Neobacillus drentensis]|uniref:Wzz/FepE/Etk N-terminal domain-containing protein n=1 Tax=Neobacillus drentensis TaxID=220684 RepID=UPI002FFF6659